ncbi:hypothetical protein M8C21_006079 [Ambrosia artemisiifolia]|uniref:Thioredoxin domain-containing protein n=1 Tax=Ambrosia artemisiifolia TaxID=4212 RepID=A0AAD5BR45_AMBAR|nr:hypothetical protein M8C21_006079 [Ambrosia artemisiifolia]
MTSSIKYSMLLMFVMLPLLSYASSSDSCPVMNYPFVYDIQLQCPTVIVYSWPVEMSWESVDKVLSSNQTYAYVAILFYASWCPFSRNMRPKFDALSSMYPQIKHVTVEQSSISPIYGLRGVPSIMIANRTTTMIFLGPKYLYLLSHFYQKATGLKPVMDLTKDPISFPENKSRTTESRNKLKNIVSTEPYLVFSLLFIFSKALLYLYPSILSDITALWHTYIPRLNLAIFGESRQLLARVLQFFDFKRVFGKQKLTRSARAWPSSL